MTIKNNRLAYTGYIRQLKYRNIIGKYCKFFKTQKGFPIKFEGIAKVLETLNHIRNEYFCLVKFDNGFVCYRTVKIIS